MRVKLLTSLASAQGPCPAGSVRDFDSKEAKRLIEAGFAEPVRASKKTEKAVTDK